MASTETHADVGASNGVTQNPEPQPPAGEQPITTDNNASKKDTENPKQDETEKKGSDSYTDKKDEDEEKPPGGYDDTKIPPAPPGYTIKITIHRAENLPMADINSLSSDPYVVSQLYTALPTRHKEDPPLTNRTFTIRKSVNPEWNAEWIIANVPASGFRLKCRIYDEDPGDHDDRLGNAHVEVPSLNEHWTGINERSLKVKKRMGSKRAYLAQALAVGTGQRKTMTGRLVISVEMIGKTESSHGGRVYTIGPMFWTKHYSPVLGRFVGKKTPGKDGEDQANDDEVKTEKYNFQANQLQLHGPVPADLYHRYVEFRPFVKRMFTHSGVRGFFLHKTLSHQHSQIYHFDRKTEAGYLSVDPSKETSLKFLELVDYDRGGRIFTYIITLDSLWRFTETGKEFGIDMLSKHTMHSNVSAYIAFSGEFFVRRVENKNQEPPELGGNNASHPPEPMSGGPPDTDPPKDPALYELIIDNDSGTYRPDADLLPKLKEFLEFNLPGIKIVTLDCQKDAELQQKLKKEQKESKKKEGDMVMYRQTSGGTSISSSDESELNHMIEGAGDDPGLMKAVKHDVSNRRTLKKKHWKSLVKGREDESGDAQASSPKADTGNGEAIKTNGVS